MDNECSDDQQQQQWPAGLLGTILKAVHDTTPSTMLRTPPPARPRKPQRIPDKLPTPPHKAVEAKDAAVDKTRGTTQSTADNARQAKDAAAQKTSSTGQRAADKVREAKDAAAEKAKQGTGVTTQKLGEYKDYAAEKAREGKDSAAEKAKECKDYAAEKAMQAKESAVEKAIRTMGYAEDKKEETKEKAGETTEMAKEEARQYMEEMKLRDEDRDDLDRARADAAKVEEASERGKGNIFSAIGNATGTIKEKLMGAKDEGENKQGGSKQRAGEPVSDKDGDGVVGSRTVLVIDKGTRFDKTLRESDQVTGQSFNDVGKIGGEDVVMTDPKK